MNQLDKKSLQELKALRRNWEDTLIREYDVLTEPTRIMMKDKIDEVKKVISTKQNNEDQAFWVDYLFQSQLYDNANDFEILHNDIY